jgi:hypothetical protein
MVRDLPREGGFPRSSTPETRNDGRLTHYLGLHAGKAGPDEVRAVPPDMLGQPPKAKASTNTKTSRTSIQRTIGSDQTRANLDSDAARTRDGVGTEADVKPSAPAQYCSS